jgi:hypothetical protein
MDEIDTFRIGALDSMQKTVDVLSGEVVKSQAYLDRVRANDGPALTDGGSLDVS